MAKMIYRKDTGEILGVHIIGLHAADLIHEASNAVATKQSVQVCNGKHLTMATFRGIHRCFFCLMTRLVWDVSILPAVLPLCPRSRSLKRMSIVM